MSKEIDTSTKKDICVECGESYSVNENLQDKEVQNLCQKCTELSKMKCICCPLINKPCRKTDTGDFIHVLCAKINPFTKKITKDVIYMKPNRWPKNKVKCYVCNKLTGYIIKCSHLEKSNKCNRYFHVPCLIESGVIFESEDYSIDTKFFCKFHSSAKKDVRTKRKRNRIIDEDESYTEEDEESMEEEEEEENEENDKSWVESIKDDETEDTEGSDIGLGSLVERRERKKKSNILNKRQKIKTEKDKEDYIEKKEQEKSLNNYLNDYVMEQKQFINDLENFLQPYIKSKKPIVTEQKSLNNENISEIVKLEKKLKDCELLIEKTRIDYQMESKSNSQYHQIIDILNKEIKQFNNSYIRIKEAWFEILNSFELIPFCGLKPGQAFDIDYAEDVLYFIKNKLSQDKNQSQFCRNVINNTLNNGNNNSNNGINNNNNRNYNINNNNNNNYKNRNNININRNKNSKIYNFNSNTNSVNFNNNKNNDNNKLNKNNSIMISNRPNNKMNIATNKNEK
ncbi:hypothetical protein BCR36DRAFT_362451, partial [Piromyces finnis]